MTNFMEKPQALLPVILYSDDVSTQPVGQCDCDGGDCACSLPSISSLPDGSQPTWPHPNQLTLSLGSQQQLLHDGHSLVYGPFHRPVILNEHAANIYTAFTQPERTLAILQSCSERYGTEQVEPTVRAMHVRGLLHRAGEQPTLMHQPQTLSVWMHVTDRCNLRCDYCYLPHLHHDMSITTGRAAIDAALRSAVAHGYPVLKLKYAGGEPLLHFDTVLCLHQYALAQGAARGVTIDGVVLSNGTLLSPERAQALRDLGLHLMVSVDGIGYTHDAQRRYAGGHGSFVDVARAVDVAIKSGLVPDISITATGKSAGHLPEVVAWALERNLPFSLNFYRENELSASFHDLQIEEQTIIAGMLAAYAVIERVVPRRSLLSSLIDRANLARPHLKTCGVGDSYMVFDHQGRVAKCQMQIRQPITTVAAQDPLALVRADQTSLQNLSVEEKEGCKSCEWKYWCAGGCPLDTFRATRRYDVKSPRCNIYKALYPQAMKIEGLRILRYGLSLDFSSYS